MATKPYLIFSLHHTRYAIAAESVVEIFLLPELIPIAEAPRDVIGLLNFHNSYIPVIHLDLRFGHKFAGCNLTDSVIAIESGDLRVGTIVHQVETVIDIDDRYIQHDLDYGRQQNIDRAFIQGIISLDDEMIILLDTNNIIRHPEALENLADSDEAQLELSRNFYESYFPSASNDVREVLSNRAANICIGSNDFRSTNLISVAVIQLNGDYFGLDLSLVKEFIKIGRITAIPCCPEHIIGNINLRGEILTLVDICSPLNLTAKNQNRSTKAIAIEVNGTTAGVVVEEIIDILDFNPEELKPIPVAIDSHTASYLKGTIDCFDRSVNIIDLAKLIDNDVMKVELTI